MYKRLRPDDCLCRLCHPENYRPETPKPAPTLPCQICKKTFKNRRSLTNHKWRVHGDNDVYCEPCEKWFKLPTYKQHLKYHKNHITDENIRTCRVCKKRVPKTYFNTHMHQHNTTKYCKTCDKWFSEASYKMHLTTTLKHVSRDQFKYTCDLCKKKFVNLTGISHHMEVIHLGRLPFKCAQCPQAYTTRSMLRKHVLTVHEKKPVPKNCICHVCGSAWETNNLLEKHMVVHTGERPYKCKTCDATFGHSGAMYTHNKLKHQKKETTTKGLNKKRNVKKTS